MSSTVDGRIAVVPTLNIKDPEVYDLAQELALRRGESMTAVIKDALLAALVESKRSREGVAEALMAIARRSAARPEPFLTDDDLYDENGLPR